MLDLERKTGYKILVKDEKYGVIDNLHKEIIPCEYDYISLCPIAEYDYVDRPVDFLYLKKDELHQIFNIKSNKFIISIKAKSLYVLQIENFISIFDYSKLKTTFYNEDGIQIFTKRNYTSIEKINEDVYIAKIVLNGKEKTGIMNKDEETIIPFEYNIIKHLKDKHFLLIKENEINSPINLIFNGNKIIKLPFNTFSSCDTQKVLLNNNIIIFRKIISSHKRYFNIFIYDFIKNELLFNTELDSYSVNDDGNITLRLGEKIGLYNIEKNKQIFDFKYNDIFKMYDNLFQVKLDDKYYIIDENEHEILPVKSNSFISSSEGILLLSNEDDKFGFIDSNGKQITDFKYSNHTSNFLGDYAPVTCDDKKFGIIDKEGNEVIPFKYHSYSQYSRDGYIIVRKGNYDALIKDGKEIIPPKKFTKLVRQFNNNTDDYIVFKFKTDNSEGYLVKEDDEFNEYFNEDCMRFINVGSRQDTLTVIRLKDNYLIETGCFIGNLQSFEKQVEDTHGKSEYGKQYREIIKYLKEIY